MSFSQHRRPIAVIFTVCAGAVVAALTIALAGCASGGPSGPDGVSPASGTPEAFFVVDRGANRPARAGEGCWNPMIDPRDGTLLVLQRSANGQGDYAVAPGRYGVRSGFVLRVDCATGVALGIVRDRN